MDRIRELYNTEAVKERLSFVEQLREQMTLCRRLLTTANSIEDSYLCISAVIELETLLWGKLNKEKDYFKRKQQIEEECLKEFARLPTHQPSVAFTKGGNKNIGAFIELNKKKARLIFRELMIFIENKKIMQIGEIED